jgi:hypothetical protein
MPRPEQAQRLKSKATKYLNMMYLYSIGAAVLLVGSVIVLGARFRGGHALDPQPIAFNHRLHLERAQGIACADCHQFVNSETYAGIPSKHICLSCHDAYGDENDPQADVNKAAFAELMRYARSDEEIPWHRVTATRDDVFFSHRRHVTVGKLDCTECHPKMPKRTEPPTRGPLIISMATCFGCHREQNATEDCVACHR